MNATTKPDLRQIGGMAILEVLATLWSMPARLRQPNDPSPPPNHSGPIASAVHLAGPRITGSVRVQLPPAFAAQAIGRLTDREATPTERRALLEDMAGELANMVAGRVAAQLAMGGYPCSLGTPKIGDAGGVPCEAESGDSRAQLDVLCEGDWLSLEVQCCYADP